MTIDDRPLVTRLRISFENTSFVRQSSIIFQFKTHHNDNYRLITHRFFCIPNPNNDGTLYVRIACRNTNLRAYTYALSVTVSQFVHTIYYDMCRVATTTGEKRFVCVFADKTRGNRRSTRKSKCSHQQHRR